jgi:hypothetical protein
MAWDRTQPVTSAALASAPVRTNFQEIDQSLMGQNFVRDPYFIIWPAGDAAAPAHYKITGTPTISRDTTNFKTHGMSAKITGSATGRIVTTVLNSTDFPTGLFRGVPFSFGCWIRTDTASIARLVLDDGVGQGVSGYAPGTSTWTWVTGTRLLDPSATKIELLFESLSATANTSFQLGTLILGSIAPQYFIPTQVSRGTLHFPFVGVQATGTRLAEAILTRPFRVEHTQLRVSVAPVTTALIVDVNHYDGSAYTTMYSTRPQIAAAALTGGAVPDGTYRYRCFQGSNNADGYTDRLLSCDVDQIGSGGAGSDLHIDVRCLQFNDPLEAFRSSTAIGNE